MPRPIRPQPTPGEVVIVLAGAATLLFSFVDWANGTNVWAKGVFPLATLVPIYGALMAAHIVTEFLDVNLPRVVVGFTWSQLQLAFGLMAGLLAICLAVTNQTDKQAGTWLELLGGLALATGAVMLQRERSSEVPR
jgi:hypothetical protein